MYFTNPKYLGRPVENEGIIVIMAGNISLLKAKNRKNDEFYTQYKDIEQELSHYKEHFYGKTVYCNCDDARNSNFFRYFILHFKELGLRKLVASGFQCLSETFLFLDDIPSEAYSVHIYNTTGVSENMGTSRMLKLLLANKANAKRKLRGDGNYLAGDFRSRECLNLLKQADIVVTNPPFSLFREYLALLIKMEKSFLVVGNKNAVTYKEVFPSIMGNCLWLGCYPVKQFIDKEGKLCVFGNVGWFTNLPLYRWKDSLLLTKKYYGPDGLPLPESNKKYLKYDNYDAINVDRVADIPIDYDGVMGVPITFLDTYHPCVVLKEGADTENPFVSLGYPSQKAKVILSACGDVGKNNLLSMAGYGINESLSNGLSDMFIVIGAGTSPDFFTPTKKYVNLLRHDKEENVFRNHIACNTTVTLVVNEKPNTTYYTADNSDKYLTSPYNRLLIQRKKKSNKRKSCCSGNCVN